MAQWVKTCHIDLETETKFEPQNPGRGRRRELTLNNCPLTSTHGLWSANMHGHSLSLLLLPLPLPLILFKGVTGKQTQGC